MYRRIVYNLRRLYDGESEEAHRFRYALLCFDIVTILFVIVTSFTPLGGVIPYIDVAIGIAVLADLGSRFAIAPRKVLFLASPVTLADIAATVSFLGALAADGAGFLRVLRTVRLLHTYQLLRRLRQDFRFFRQKEEVIVATINIAVFLVVVTGLIYATQHRVNPEINNYADALYFTVTTLTTTGFGDIILMGTAGRLIAVGVMIVGVTLFLRLAQVLFRPPKVRQPCPECGLILHDADAVHCKHCGSTINIKTEGAV
jgi:voltage-gated potassium channel